MAGRTARGKRYAISVKWRKTVEEVFSWAKGVGDMRKTRFFGLAKITTRAFLTFAYADGYPVRVARGADLGARKGPTYRNRLRLRKRSTADPAYTIGYASIFRLLRI